MNRNKMHGHRLRLSIDGKSSVRLQHPLQNFYVRCTDQLKKIVHSSNPNNNDGNNTPCILINNNNTV